MLWEEMKKIWRPGMVLLLLLLGVVFYTMFLEFYIRHFPNGPYNTRMLEEGKRLVLTYGTNLSQKEMAELEKEISALRSQADRYVRESEIGKKHGLETYEQYDAFMREASQAASAEGVGADQKKNYKDSMRLRQYLQDEKMHNIEERLYAACWFVETYHAKETYGPQFELTGASTKEQPHAKLFYADDKKWQNILPYEVPLAASAYAGYLLVWICVSVCILLSPLLVRDRMSRMRSLQYSSRRGRGIYRSQLAAVMLSALLVTAGNLAVFGGLFLTRGTAVFFPCRMYSFAVMQLCWPDWTHGAWCLMLVFLCYLMAVGTAGIVFCLAQGSRNYVIMLLRIVPLATALALFCPKLMENAFYFGNKLYQLSGIPYVELWSAGAVFVVGMGLCALGCRQFKKDV